MPLNESNPKPSSRVEVVPHTDAGERLDQVAARLFPEYSRARLQQWIQSGNLLVNGEPTKAKHKVRGGETLSLEPIVEPQGDWLAQDLPLNIVYEDEHILVLNKGANAVVHPAAGNASGTVLNALLHHCPDLINLPRGGIVHRLDKDTTGLMVVAKTLTAHQDLVAQLQQRRVGRHYQAVVVGLVDAEGKVKTHIGRHPRQRKKMAVLSNGGKEAITHYQVVRRFACHSHVALKLETGRTHQIRVHMQHIGHPLVGDPVYGGRARTQRRLSLELNEALKTFPRQALHAAKLALIHPLTRQSMAWDAPMPEDMSVLIDKLSSEGTIEQ